MLMVTGILSELSNKSIVRCHSILKISVRHSFASALIPAEPSLHPPVDTQLHTASLRAGPPVPSLAAEVDDVHNTEQLFMGILGSFFVSKLPVSTFLK